MGTQITSANTNSIDGSARVVVRNSAGTLYALVIDTNDASLEIWKSSDGTSWAEQDTSNNPAGYVIAASCAIDSDDVIYIAYCWRDYQAPTNYDLMYVEFDTDTDTFGTPDTVEDVGNE